MFPQSGTFLLLPDFQVKQYDGEISKTPHDVQGFLTTPRHLWRSVKAAYAQINLPIL